MRSIFVIAQHEYLVNVRRVAFLIFTFAVPFIGALMLLAFAFFSGAIGNFFSNQFDGEAQGPTIIGVVDQAGIIEPILPDYADQYQRFVDRSSGEAALRAADIRALAIIPADYLTSGEVTVVRVAQGGGLSGLPGLEEDTLTEFLRAHLLRNQLDPTRRTRILEPFTPIWVTLQAQGAQAEDDAAAIGNVFFGYTFGILLGIAVFTSAGYLLQGVARDKSDRIVEILLSSVSARQLLAGKVLGLGALGLTQLAVWILSLLLLGAIGANQLGVAPAALGFLFARPEFLLLDILYFILGFLLYAVLMGSVGALGTSQQQSQQMAGVFTFFAVIPFMLGSLFLSNPNAPLVRVLSWFPITAPTAMLLRLPLARSLPWIDIVGSLAILTVTILLVIWLGGKIFRLGLLIYGQRPSIGRVWRALREA
jgi:ABC-2 type transport system permease protein